MEPHITVQGRALSRADIEYIRQLIAQHPSWSRRRLSIELSTTWQWVNAKGTLKDMACRSMLVKLDDKGYIQLPARRQTPTNRMVDRREVYVSHDTEEICSDLSALRPLDLVLTHEDKDKDALHRCLLSRYHYLGLRGVVGENMRYLVMDRRGRTLACVLFGAPAWSCASRDRYLGWDTQQRQCHLNRIGNNTRFLILPWVNVPCLASHILSRVVRRISQDWVSRYGHDLALLETFVDTARFAGTCYRAANWQYVGHTQGRGRNDRYYQSSKPTKAVYLYPLSGDFRDQLVQ